MEVGEVYKGSCTNEIFTFSYLLSRASDFMLYMGCEASYSVEMSYAVATLKPMLGFQHLRLIRCVNGHILRILIEM